MKKIGKTLLCILGVITWLLFLLLFRDMDTEYNSHTHQIILIITGVLLAIYIFKKTDSGAKALEKENQELKTENQKLRQELQNQAVRYAIEKTTKEEEKRNS